MTAPPSVVHVDTAVEWRGGQAQVARLARGMAQAGWDVTVACPQHGRLWREVEGEEVRRLAVPVGWSPRTGWRVSGLGADIVAAHTSHAHGSLAPFPVRLVVHRRVDFVPGGGWKYRRPDGYVAVSGAVARIVEAAGGRRVSVVFDGVDPLPQADPAIDGPTVLAVGARVAHKGHVHLAAAARLLSERGVPVDVGVAGDGPLVYEGLRWLGSRQDVAALLAAAKVFVHPSVEEGMGQAVVEAMLAGVPCVVSDAGGLPEVVGDTAIVVPKADPAALADGILQALAGRHPPVDAARRRAAERFSVASMVQGTISAYRRLLGDPPVAL